MAKLLTTWELRNGEWEPVSFVLDLNGKALDFGYFNAKAKRGGIAVQQREVR